MSESTAEVAYLPLKAGVGGLDKGDSPKIWNDTLKTVTSQPGCKGAYWGVQIEHPGIIELVVDWESYQAHKDFMASPKYGPFVDAMEPLFSFEDLKMFHVKLSPQSPFSNPRSSKVTECISLFFEFDYPASNYDKNWAEFVEKATKTADEAKGIIGGWAIEEQKHKLGGSEEVPAKLFGAFIGWPSVDAHMKYRESKAFPDVIQHLRDGPKALAVHHVEFQKF